MLTTNYRNTFYFWNLTLVFITLMSLVGCSSIADPVKNSKKNEDATNLKIENKQSEGLRNESPVGVMKEVPLEYKSDSENFTLNCIEWRFLDKSVFVPQKTDIFFSELLNNQTEQLTILKVPGTSLPLFDGIYSIKTDTGWEARGILSIDLNNKASNVELGDIVIPFENPVKAQLEIAEKKITVYMDAKGQKILYTLTLPVLKNTIKAGEIIETNDQNKQMVYSIDGDQVIFVGGNLSKNEESDFVNSLKKISK